MEGLGQEPGALFEKATTAGIRPSCGSGRAFPLRLCRIKMKQDMSHGAFRADYFAIVLLCPARQSLN